MKKKILLSTLSLSSLVLASAAPAEEVGRWYVTPQVGGLFTDDDRNLDDSDFLYGVSIGKHVNERWSGELNVNKSDLSGLKPLAASLDLLRVYRRNQTLAPYLTFGAGAMRHEFNSGSKHTDFIAQGGVGLLWQLGENRRDSGAFTLRPEIKARWHDAAGTKDFTDFIAMLGFQFAFGAAPMPATPPRETPPAPPAEPEPEPAPAPQPPADSDGDGVPDTADRCPDTRPGVAVDDTGCPQRGEITLTGVAFETNSAALTSESHAGLDRLASDLRKYPQLRIELQGHTDSSGSDEYNQRLSQERANSVRDYLLRRGASSSQVVARGYGESRPIADNNTVEGRAQNRRVVMVVLQNPGDVDVKTDE